MFSVAFLREKNRSLNFCFFLYFSASECIFLSTIGAKRYARIKFHGIELCSM